MSWWLVGVDHELAYFIVQAWFPFPPEEPAWRVTKYIPGHALDDGPPADPKLAEHLSQFCSSQLKLQTLNWDDVAKARDLYWSYRSRLSHPTNPASPTASP